MLFFQVSPSTNTEHMAPPKGDQLPRVNPTPATNSNAVPRDTAAANAKATSKTTAATQKIAAPKATKRHESASEYRKAARKGRCLLSTMRKIRNLYSQNFGPCMYAYFHFEHPQGDVSSSEFTTLSDTNDYTCSTNTSELSYSSNSNHSSPTTFSSTLTSSAAVSIPFPRFASLVPVHCISPSSSPATVSKEPSRSCLMRVSSIYCLCWKCRSAWMHSSSDISLGSRACSSVGERGGVGAGVHESMSRS